MKRDIALILIASLIGLVIALILLRGCGNIRPTSDRIDVQKIYDSVEVVIKSNLPAPDTIFKIEEKVITKWLPSATIVDTVYINGGEIYVYNDSPIDTNAILTHYLTQAVTYIDTIRDSSLQAIISDIIFRNRIRERTFSYKILRPAEVKHIDNRDRFQLIASFQAGAGAAYTNQLNGIYAGADIGLKFKNGTYFSVGYMAGTGHFATIRAGRVIRLRRKN